MFSCLKLVQFIRFCNLKIQIYLQKLTNGKDNWSISELVHALILLANFHALSSFVYGCGITPEVDHDGGYTYSSKSSPSNSSGNSRSTSKHTSPSSSFSEVSWFSGENYFLWKLRRRQTWLVVSENWLTNQPVPVIKRSLR